MLLVFLGGAAGGLTSLTSVTARTVKGWRFNGDFQKTRTVFVGHVGHCHNSGGPGRPGLRWGAYLDLE